jgi:hypothetical protein
MLLVALCLKDALYAAAAAEEFGFSGNVNRGW